MQDKIKRFLKHRLEIWREEKALRQIPALPCQTASLRSLSMKDLAKLLESPETSQEWMQSEADLKRAFPFEDGKTHGVNPGDRRAVWYLIKSLGPTSVLEIGTNVGASTLHIAAALQSQARRDSAIRPRLVTVDIQDVNDGVSAPWKQRDLPRSPREMMQAYGCGEFVTFVAETSLNYLSRCPDKFDFIFLDGDHSATTVYQEIPAALKLLSRNGLILLHDYFPNHRPLWANGILIPGPLIATRRLRREGNRLTIIPLGNLPWPTKQGTHTTSLALLTRYN